MSPIEWQLIELNLHHLILIRLSVIDRGNRFLRLTQKYSLKRIVQVLKVTLGDLRRLEVDYHFSDFDIILVSLLYDESYVSCPAPHRKAKTKADGEQRGHGKYSKRFQKYQAELVKEEKTYSHFPLLIAKMLRMRTRKEGSFYLPSDGNTWKYLARDFHPVFISQIYLFPIVNIDTVRFSIFKYMSTCLLSFGGVDVTGITQLESSGVPDLEKSVQGWHL